MQAGSLNLTLRQVNAKDCTGATALHRAASTGRTDIIRLLLGAKAKIDACNKDKATPLLLAAIAGHQPAAILLAGKGADVEVGRGAPQRGWLVTDRLCAAVGRAMCACLRLLGGPCLHRVVGWHTPRAAMP